MPEDSHDRALLAPDCRPLGGAAGALVTIIGLMAWGAATGGRGGAVAWLVCLGGVVVPAGFAVGCAVGAVMSVVRALIRSGSEPDYWK